MGVTYYYLDSATRETIPISRIDAELALELPHVPLYLKTPFDDSDSIMSSTLSTIGMCATKSGEWNEEKFRASFKCLGNNFITPDIALKFLNGRYTFVSER